MPEENATTGGHDAPRSPILNITGERICLGPQSRDSAEAITRWENDFEVAIWSGDPLRPQSHEKTLADAERFMKEMSQDFAGFMIYERATMRHIGLCGLRRIDHRLGTAEMGIMIGEKDCWGKGYGTEATRLLLEYGFSVLGLHNVLLTTYAYNERALGAYRRAGFREIGRRREAALWGGRRYDIVFMDCLAGEHARPATPVLPNFGR